MREFAKISPLFWVGETGKALRRQGMEAQIVAMYLLTSPHANMIGLFYCPVAFIAHETGLPFEGASEGLRRASEAGFCSYDPATEIVWVPEMAGYQIAEQLKPTDNRCRGIQAEYERLPQNPFLDCFFEKYGRAFHLRKWREKDASDDSPFEGASEGLRSKEKEKEKEKENFFKHIGEPSDSPSLAAHDDKVPACPHEAIIAEYHRILPEHPRVCAWTEKRRRHLQARWRADPERQTLDWWQVLFEYIGESDFLSGKTHAKDRAPFLPGLDWFVRSEDNLVSVLEGKYHREAA